MPATATIPSPPRSPAAGVGRKEASAEDDEGFVYCSGGRLWKRCRTCAGEYLLNAARYGQALSRLSTPTDAHHSAEHYSCDEGDEHSNIHALKMKAHKTEIPHSLSFAL
jgi:hypothetical protein